ncbi:hypothetical protein EYZ11_001889 [Aspergillus tanneri]|uniref:Uncharacterized protein n=1 Tax=Aspergillus tanneri TaxID=1220188 RepID=A0A4S3JU83_9EURO|nr:hypothetical protein EYZ11_001889 [Aspergillus tanneri]
MAILNQRNETAKDAIQRSR